jgi:hypothetical protein
MLNDSIQIESGFALIRRYTVVSQIQFIRKRNCIELMRVIRCTEPIKVQNQYLWSPIKVNKLRERRLLLTSLTVKLILHQSWSKGRQVFPNEVFKV